MTSVAALDPTDATLSDWRRTPHAYGESDCVLAAAEHFIRLGARREMPYFAGTYHDHETAMEVLGRLGGMAQVMEIIGGMPTEDAPARGDIVGLLTGEDGYFIPALCTGDGLATKLERGVVEMRFGLVEWSGVWRAPQGAME